MLASITTTSGGLLITAELTSDFVIFDTADGTELYRFNTGAPNNGGNGAPQRQRHYGRARCARTNSMISPAYWMPSSLCSCP